MNISFDYYRIFCYVARHRSITQAAAALGSSQPNVTRCINNLEHALGCRLFFRTNRGVTLTAEGERLYTHVSDACDRLERTEDELSGVRELELGSVSIGATETALHVFLLDRLRRFHERHPNIHICISYLNAPQAFAALRAGQVDIAAVAVSPFIPLPLRAVSLCSFQDILIAGPRFAGLAQRQLTLQEVNAYPFISIDKDTMTYQFYNQLFLDNSLTMKAETTVANIGQILPLVKNDLGLSFVPEPFAREALEQGEVLRLPLAQDIPARRISLIRDPARPLSAAARALERVLTEPS